MTFSVGRLLAGLLFTTSLVAACGGRSENLESGDDSADEGQGGTGGSGSGGGVSGSATGGALSVGGTSSGGTSFGGTGTGAVSGSSGATGVGGSSPCGACPLADYGLVIEGDGAPYEMHFNGTIIVAEAEARPGDPIACPVEVLYGTLGGCSRSLTLFACEDPMNGRPCLEVTGRTARYVDRATGALWDGMVMSDLAKPFEPGVASGTLELEFTNGSAEPLVLSVAYTFCTAGNMFDIVCSPP